MTPDEAYANSAYIPDGESYYARWEAEAAAFRARTPHELGVPYGDRGRQTYDLFPSETGRFGTVIFVHGGSWMAGSSGMFSHLAKGAVQAGYACALVNYPLCPEARIADITSDVARAIGAIADRVAGPLYLVGHSAGGHLVARMGCVDRVADWSTRVRRIMAISPLSDLAPLMETTMNATLGIDAAEARAESPIHHARQDLPVTAWVGGAERPAFLDQAQWLADAWTCDHHIDGDRHHFDVIEGLENPDSAIMRALLS